VTDDPLPTPPRPATLEKLKPAPLLLTFVVGLALVALALVADLRWGWTDIRPSVFLEVGAALALVGVIFTLERRFVGQVRIESAATKRRFEARTSAIEQQLDEYRIRLDNLTKHTEAVTHLRYASQNAAIAALEDNISRDTVMAALQEAERLGSIAGLRVRASDDVVGMRLVFETLSFEPGWGDPSVDPSLELTVQPHFLDKPLKMPIPGIPGSGGTPLITWQEDWSVAEFCDRIIELLQEGNRYVGTATFSPEILFSSLKRVLSVAIASRRGDDPEAPHLEGRLIEMVDDDWYLTDEGLECPAREFLLDRHSIHPPRARSKAPASDGSDLERAPHWTEAEPPDYVSSEYWQTLLRLAKDAVPEPHRFDPMR
jgi:hypothetical protein